MTAFPLVCWLATTWLSAADGCVQLTGIGYGPDDVYTPEELVDFPLGRNQVNQQFLNAIGLASAEAGLETPISIYQAAELSVVLVNALGPFEDKPLDFFGRADKIAERRRCGTDDANITSSDFYLLHYKLTYLYLEYYFFSNASGSPEYNEAGRGIGDIMESEGLDPFICDNPDTYDCMDPAFIGTPWGLAFVVAVETKKFFLASGWNADGSNNREFNRVRFEDWRDDSTRYVPRNDPWVLENLDAWQPLTENNDRGFIFNQEHVTPHIGYTAKSLFYTDEEVCARTLYDPFYDYSVEIDLALERLANLTDEIKMEIEFFDNKITSLSFFTVLTTVLGGLDADLLEGNIGFIIESIANYEGIIAVWKAKVDYDRIRPPSLIQEVLRDDLITTYAGVNENGETFGTRTYRGADFQPYIRTMPHAEYPSASACLCAAFARAKQFETGTDALPFPLGRPFPPRSSANEPGSTPNQTVTLTYFTWSQISQRCGETRYEGGMHFTEAVPAGAALCEDIGTKVAENVINIVNGIAPDYVIDFDDLELRERDCYPAENACTLPKKCTSEPCGEEEAGMCANYKDGVGCKWCKPGFYLYDRNHPCIDCQRSCGDCKVCKNFVGCKKCQNGRGPRGKRKFDLDVDETTGLRFCRERD